MIVLEDLNTRTNIPQPGFAPNDSATIGRVKILAKTGSVLDELKDTEGEEREAVSEYVEDDEEDEEALIASVV